MHDVVVLCWPDERQEQDRLTLGRVPRLLLVASHADPPTDDDPLLDWVRLPADDRDIQARITVLRQRAAAVPPLPEIDEHGRLLLGGQWVGLSAAEERLARPLVERYGDVVPEADLVAVTGPSGTSHGLLRVHLSRLRRRIRPLGLQVTGIRREGYLLERVAST